MARIENHKYSIEQAFRECFYIVPDYQREYVWTDKEVNEILDDINEQFDTGAIREYFIGTILVSPTETRDHYEIIDGQQRLTTFFLLLCVMKNLFEHAPQQRQMITSLISTSFADSAGEIQTSLRLEPRYENAIEVMSQLVEFNSSIRDIRAGIQAAGITSFGSLENLVAAYESIQLYLSDNYGDIDKLKKYWGYLANNVVFIQISTDVNSALKIFETINERGIGLNPMDLLQNLLFTQVRQDKFTQLKDEWKKITKPLEKEKEKPLRFLRYFLMANYVIKNERKDSVVREDEIYEWFVASDNAHLCNYANKPIDFIRKVAHNVDQYLAFAKGMGNDGKPNIAMDSLKRLTGGAFSLHYILLLAAANFPKPLFDHFVSQLESFLFYYIFTKTPTKDLERNFSLWADDLREIAKLPDSNQQIDQLNTFIANRFENSMASKSQELYDALNRFTLYSMQLYRTRYLLARLTQHVDMAFQGVKEPGNLEPFMRLEIEHILPNSPTSEVRAKWFAENPGASYDDYKNKLGNLTLLEKPINIVASNDFYGSKLDEYRKSANYLTRGLAQLTEVGENTSISRINSKLKAFASWNATSIDKRHKMLADLAKDVWKTKLFQG
jgi:hypothetical protein